MLVLYNVCAALATPLELRNSTYYQEREQRAANVRVWHLALMNRPAPANVVCELKKYLTLDHAQC